MDEIEKIRSQLIALTESCTILDSQNENLRKAIIGATKNECTSAQEFVKSLAGGTDNVSEYFDEYMDQSVVIYKGCIGLLGEIERSNYIVLERQRLVEKDNRSNAWKMWRDKTLRWVGGAVAAVGLYTLFVWLESKGIVTIPVKDLITSK